MKNIKITLVILVIFNLKALAQGITIGSSTTFTGGSAIITCTGNWNNSGTFTAGSSTIIFNGASGNQTITNSSGETFNNLTINKAANDLQLSNNTIVNGTLTVTSGDLDLNGYTCVLGSSATLSETAGNTVKGTSGVIKTTRTLNAPSSENVAGLGAIITSSANLGSTIIERGHEAQSSGGNDGIERYYSFAPTTNTGLNATLIFSYDDSELNSITESTLGLYSSDDEGSTWSSMGGTLNTTTNQIELAGIDAFDIWTAGGSGAPLPVELVSFIAFTQLNIVELNWQTATEVNNYGFEIERTSTPLNPRTEGGAEEWETLGFVDGHGNSNLTNDYSYTDISTPLSNQLSYRLKQIDTDGSFEYSKIVEVEIDIPIEYKLSQNYPNPFNPSTTIKYSIPVVETLRATSLHVTLKVYDILGKEVATLVNESRSAGNYKVEFDASKLTSGTYFYRLVSDNFSQTKKILLLK